MGLIDSLDGSACPECESDNTVECGPPDGFAMTEMLCAGCGHVWVILEVF